MVSGCAAAFQRRMDGFVSAIVLSLEKLEACQLLYAEFKNDATGEKYGENDKDSETAEKLVQVR